MSNATQSARVLLVEDEEDLVSSLSYSLQAAGYQVSSALDGATALRLAAEQSPHIVLLDIMLPDMSGLEVCRRIRAADRPHRPIVIMVTARGEEMDRVVGFEVGADDYLVKPFSVRELILRMGARQRALPDDKNSASLTPAKGCITVGSLEVDSDSHRVFVSGHEIHVSALEMRLLLHLLEVPGKVRYRRELLTEVWGYHPEVCSRTLDTHVKRLRQKLADASGYIHTVRGVGYRIVAQPAVKRASLNAGIDPVPPGR